MSKKVPSNLLEQNSALSSYLDDMLHQATEGASLAKTEEIDQKLLPESLLLEAEALEEETISIAVDNSVEQKFEIKQEIESEAPDVEQPELSAELFPLQFLMFRVGDNLLALPLVKMASVIDWPEVLTRLPNEPGWVHGILQHRDHKVRIVDSSTILEVKNQSADSPRHILILEGDKWGLSCDAIENVITLDYGDIQWSQKAGNKMTLGTIKNSLASLLSPGGIIESLQFGA